MNPETIKQVIFYASEAWTILCILLGIAGWIRYKKKDAEEDAEFKAWVSKREPVPPPQTGKYWPWLVGSILLTLLAGGMLLLSIAFHLTHK